MTHTSPEQPDALRLADLCAADWDLVRPHLVVQMLRDLHARVQELEASQARLNSVINEVLHLQEKFYGDGAGTHIALSKWANRHKASQCITQEKQGCGDTK